MAGKSNHESKFAVGPQIWPDPHALAQACEISHCLVCSRDRSPAVNNALGQLLNVRFSIRRTWFTDALAQRCTTGALCFRYRMHHQWRNCPASRPFYIALQFLPLKLNSCVLPVRACSDLRLCGRALKQLIELLLLMLDSLLTVKQRLKASLNWLDCLSKSKPGYGDS